MQGENARSMFDSNMGRFSYEKKVKDKLNNYLKHSQNGEGIKLTSFE